MSPPKERQPAIAATRPDVREIVRPWVELREKWQAILDLSVPLSPRAVEAQGYLDWIDNQIARAYGTR